MHRGDCRVHNSSITTVTRNASYITQKTVQLMIMKSVDVICLALNSAVTPSNITCPQNSPTHFACRIPTLGRSLRVQGPEFVCPWFLASTRCPGTFIFEVATKVKPRYNRVVYDNILCAAVRFEGRMLTMLRFTLPLIGGVLRPKTCTRCVGISRLHV